MFEADLVLQEDISDVLKISVGVKKEGTEKQFWLLHVYLNLENVIYQYRAIGCYVIRLSEFTDEFYCF